MVVHQTLTLTVVVRLHYPQPFILKERKKEVHTMDSKIKALKIRIELLTNRDPVTNSAIIKKLQRKVRALENK